jgi:hypothetical protein
MIYLSNGVNLSGEHAGKLSEPWEESVKQYMRMRKKNGPGMNQAVMTGWRFNAGVQE